MIDLEDLEHQLLSVSCFLFVQQNSLLVIIIIIAAAKSMAVANANRFFIWIS
jgi:hypothetical protein